MSTTSAITSFLVGLAGGASVAAAVTGGFTLRVKKNRRVQQRRARVYIDMLSWIQARQLTVQAKVHKSEGTRTSQESTGTRTSQEDNGTGTSQEDNGTGTSQGKTIPSIGDSASAPKVTFPDLRAVQDHVETDPPGKQYFVTLRARIVAFGSHDMARAFDKWTAVYLKVLNGEANSRWSTDVTSKTTPISNAAAIFPAPTDASETPTDTPETHRRDSRREFRELNKLKGPQRLLPIWVVKWRDPGMPEYEPGGLTKAIERCASKELRKG